MTIIFYIGGWVDAKPAYWLNGELHELSSSKRGVLWAGHVKLYKRAVMFILRAAPGMKMIFHLSVTGKTESGLSLRQRGAIEYAVIKGIGVTEGGSVVAAVQYDQVRKAGCFVNGQWKGLSTSYGENFRITSMSVCGEDYYVLGYSGEWTDWTEMPYYKASVGYFKNEVWQNIDYSSAGEEYDSFDPDQIVVK